MEVVANDADTRRRRAADGHGGGTGEVRAGDGHAGAACRCCRWLVDGRDTVGGAAPSNRTSLNPT